MSTKKLRSEELFDTTAGEIVELGNKLLDEHGDENLWALASGMLAGAVQFWLYSRQPCDDPECEDCEPYSSATLRQEELIEEAMQFALSSEYFHSPNDRDVGKA